MESPDSKSAVLEFLRSCFVMSVATSDQNKPSVAILLYYVDDEMNFYFATHTDSTKAKNIKNNSNVSLCVWEHGKMLVQVAGEANEMQDNSIKMHILDKIAEAAAKGQNFWPPIFRIKGEGYVVFKVKPTWIRTLDLKTNTLTQVESPFTELKLD